MTIVTISAAGVAAVLLAVQLKGLKGEYATYLASAAGFSSFFMEYPNWNLFWKRFVKSKAT